VPALAVLIDCWSAKHSRCARTQSGTAALDQCMQNIQDFCLHEPDLVSVCLATYGEPHTKKVPREGTWWIWGDRFFNQETKFDAMRQAWQHTDFADMEITHPLVRHMPERAGQQRFAAFDTLHILYYCNFVMPEIDSIYFLGTAWDICVKVRPVGWLQVASLQYHDMFVTPKKFLSHRQCVLTEDCQTPAQLQCGWHAIPDTDRLELKFDQIVW